MSPEKKQQSQRLFWLTGDRFACLLRRDQILKTICKDKGWGVKHLPVFDNANALYASISENTLFGATKNIYIYDGSLPENGKCVDFLKKLNENKRFILIEDSVDRRTSFFKSFGDLNDHCPVILKGDRLEYKEIDTAKKILKKMVGNRVSPEVLSFLSESMDYDYGCVLNEIEKIEVYFGETKTLTVEMIEEIVADKRRLRIDKYVNGVIRGEVQNSLNVVAEMFENSLTTDFVVQSIMALHESFHFMLLCRTAIDGGIKNPSDIGGLVSSVLKSNPEIARRRYLALKDSIVNRSSEKLATSMRKIYLALNDSFYSRGNPSFILKSLTVSII